MYNVSNYFQKLIREPGRTFDMKVTINNTEYGTNNIVEMGLQEAIAEGEDFAIGNAIATRFDLEIRTEDSFEANAEVRPYIMLHGEGASTEWLPLGVFYIDSREYVEGGVWRYVCYDKLMLANQPWETNLTLPNGMLNVMNEICGILDIEIAEDTIINNLFEVPLMTHEFTMRQVIGYIAGCHAASARINKDGKLVFVIPKQGEVV